jgi:hypothetical protein
VNTRNLKIINFKHELHPRLGLETSNNKIGVRKSVLLAISCSINVDNFGANLKDCEQENLVRGERKNQIVA